MSIPEDKARRLAELEAKVRNEPNNPDVHLKWIIQRVMAESTPDGRPSPQRTAMRAWAVVELNRLLPMQGHTQSTKGGVLYWIAHYLKLLERWADAAHAYDKYWNYLVSEKIESEGLEFMNLEEAAEVYERTGRIEDAKRALSDWLAGAVRCGEMEEWQISEMTDKLAALSK
jgi:hypothetical protein